MRPDLQMEMMPVASLAALRRQCTHAPQRAGGPAGGVHRRVRLQRAGAGGRRGADRGPWSRPGREGARPRSGALAIRLGHLTEAQARAFRLADNQLALNSTWDESLLAAELRELRADEFDLGVIGFDQAALDRLLADAAGDETGGAAGDPDAPAPEPPVVPVTRPGDLCSGRTACSAAMPPPPPMSPACWPVRRRI